MCCSDWLPFPGTGDMWAPDPWAGWTAVTVVNQMKGGKKEQTPQAPPHTLGRRRSGLSLAKDARAGESGPARRRGPAEDPRGDPDALQGGTWEQEAPI